MKKKELRNRYYNVKVDENEREKIKDVLGNLKFSNGYKSETDCLLHLVDFYLEKKTAQFSEKEYTLNSVLFLL